MSNNYSDEIADFINSAYNKLQMIRSLFTSDKKILIHGIGNFGTATYRILTDAGITVKGFIDRKGVSSSTYLSLPVYDINFSDGINSYRNEIIIIISYQCSEEALVATKSSYFAKGYKNVIYFLEVYALLVSGNLAIAPSKTFSITSGFSINFDNIFRRIISVAGLWEDEESRITFKSFLAAILNGNPNLFAPATKQPQYFVNDIPFKNGYSRFVDCGAFNGDTANALIQHVKNVQKIVCFEPDNGNFELLSANFKKQRIASEQILMPCGVWERTEMLMFRSGSNSTSSISQAGDTYIQCVAIDDVIPDFNPTFIKMDVEGAEYEALRGAKKTIQESTPDLAISVYHRIEHMWEIPLLIQSIFPNYILYLRSHGQQGVETIMYATLR